VISRQSQSHAFSSASLANVSDVQISQGSPLSLKNDVVQRIAAAKLAGADHFMSSKNMHQFLDMLLRLVAKPVRIYQHPYREFILKSSEMIVRSQFPHLGRCLPLSGICDATASKTNGA
jgi:hypothetical protein